MAQLSSFISNKETMRGREGSGGCMFSTWTASVQNEKGEDTVIEPLPIGRI